MEPKRLSCLCLTSIIVSACAGPHGSKTDPLPFNVAILPVRTEENPGDRTESDAAMRLRIDPQRVRESLARVLGQRCFVQVSLLDPLAPGDGMSPLDRGLVADLGADLLLQCSVDCDPFVQTELNEKFWLNLPLFVLGGPLSYFVDDRTYKGRARIRASILDVHPILAGRATLEDGRSECMYAEGRFSDTTLDFLDRAGGDLRYYGLSLVVPVGLLVKSGEAVEASVARRVADELAQALAEEILVRTDALSGAGRVCDFFLAPGARLERSARGWTLSGRVLVRADSRTRLAWCRASIGEESVTVNLSPVSDDLTVGDRYREYPFELQLNGEGPHARLVIASGGRDPQVRSYTIAGS